MRAPRTGKVSSPPRPDRLRRARKRFGQHFLERAWVEKVIGALAPGPAQTFLEIGPGRGALTRPLTAAAGRVIAFEIDRDLAADLRATGPANLLVVEGDFLDVTPARFRDALSQVCQMDPILDAGLIEVRAAGNLPYNVASPILFKLAELYTAGLRLADATVMLQREVADRLLAPPGGREYGVLSVLIRHVAEVDWLLSVPPGAFRPVPGVHSAVVRLRFHADDPPARDRQAFAELVQAVFTRRRKTLANALLAYALASKASISGALARSGIDGGRRPETLEVAELVRLSDAFLEPG
jgi:16S rRNA (adenine1518-N6/adenine1519-N6)-dimethyltransferase